MLSKFKYTKLLISGVIAIVLVSQVFIWNQNRSQAVPNQDDRPKAFLTLPFKEGTNFQIAEGWLYSGEERKMHGRKVHYGIDFAANRGTPVYAAADGLAIASFDTEEYGKWQDKKLGFGYGRFVQVWNPDTKSFMIYAHLETIAPNIYYEKPAKNGIGWKPSLPKSKEEVETHENTPIKKGDLIGYVGDTGLTWGYDETPKERPNPEQFPSWDETHLHFEVFNYDEEGQKVAYDPYGIYKQAVKYTDMQIPNTSLWLLDDKDKPYFTL